jgi:DNA-binding XRE family transcriptional regulator
VQFAMMRAAERHGEFIADLLGQPARLGKAKMIGDRRVAARRPGRLPSIRAFGSAPPITWSGSPAIFPIVWDAPSPKGGQPHLKRRLDPLLIGGRQRFCLPPGAGQHKMLKHISPAQCRGGRALLDMTQPQLASIAGVGLSTVVDFERQRRTVSEEAIRKMQEALENAGI